MRITINGASDDLVEVEGDCPGADEYYVPGGRWSGDLIAPGGAAMRVVVSFEADGWRARVEQADEVVPLPDWPTTTERPDSDDPDGVDDVLHVDAPDGTRVDNITGAEG